MKSPGKALLWTLLPLLLLTPPLLWQGKRFTNQLAETERLRTQQTLALHADSVQRSFDRIHGKLDSLAVFVAGQTAAGHEVDPHEFNTFAEGLHASSKWVRAIQVVSNGIITHTYPLRGNEAILGYNLLKDPRPVLGGDVLRAQRTGGATITGPIELIQGGLGLMIRKAVPRTNDAPMRLAAIILSVPPLLAESGINPDGGNNLQLAIRRESGETFLGAPTVFAQQPVICRIALPDGAWELAGRPLTGWQAGQSPALWWFYATGFIVIGLFSTLFFARAHSEANLSATVRERTEALHGELVGRQQAQEQFRLIMENLADMVAVLDLDGHRLYNSPSYDRILGSPNQLVGTSSFEQIHPEDRERVRAVFQDTVRTGIGHRMQYRLVDRNGRARYIESQGSVIRDHNGQIIKVVVVSRDVTERQQTEQILQENEARYRFLFEHNPMPMLIYERGPLQLLAVNEAFVEHYGYSQEEALALRLTDLYPDDQKEKIAALISQLRGHAHVGEWRHRKRNGSFITIVVSSHDIAFAGRDARVAVITDISERKLTEEALKSSAAAFRSLFESSPPAAVLVNWTMQQVNFQMTKLTGYSKAELLGQSPRINYADDAEFERVGRDLSEMLARDGIGIMEAHHRRKNGELYDVLISACTLDAKSPSPKVVVTLMDITERKQAEKQIHQLHEQLQRYAGELEQRVLVRTTELAVARDRAEAADRIKSAFLATMSHELRTPLNSIIGFTGILLQGLAGPMNPEQTKQLGMVQNSARHLLALINDVLDISKIEAGQIEIALVPFDLREAIEKVLHLVAPLADKKQLPLIQQVGPEVGLIVSDRRRVKQILLNLLSNAIKFTQQGTVTLKVTSAEDMIRFAITDTGMGIKPEDLDKLFLPFRQLDSGLTRQHEGTGLGLAICKRLVERLGGTISVASQWGKGSTFEFTLPVCMERKHETHHPAH